MATKSLSITNHANQKLTLQLGAIYEHHSLIVRITRIGSREVWQSKGEPDKLPNCIEYQRLGWTELPNRWWENQGDWLKRPKQNLGAGHFHQDRVDARYFSEWNGLGILFETTKARKLHKMFGIRARLGLQYQTAKNTCKGLLALKKKLETWDQTARALFDSAASKDPKLQPPPIVRPPPRPKINNAWDKL